MSFLSFFKFALFIYNFLVMAAGATLLGLAIYFYVDSFPYMDIHFRTWPIYSTFFILLITVALLTFIVGFIGCCGACKESTCMLFIYTLIVLFAAMAVAIIVYSHPKYGFTTNQVKTDLAADIKDIIQKSYTRYEQQNFANLVIDKIQDDFQCCGSFNYTDWKFSLQNNATRPDIGVGSGLSSSSYIVAQPTSGNQPFQLGPQTQPQIYSSAQQQQQLQPSQIGMANFRVPTSCCASRFNENSYNQCRAMIARYDANPAEQQSIRIPNVNQDGCVERVYNYLFVLNWWPLNIVLGLAIGLQGLSLIFACGLCIAISKAMPVDYDAELEDNM